MANAQLDQNSRPTLTAVSSTDGSIVQVYADPTTHRLLVDSTGVVALNTVITTTGGTTVLSAAQNNSTSIEVTGVLASNAIIVVANLKAPFAVENLTTGAFTLTFKTAAGAGVTVAQGVTTMLYANGTNCEVAISTGGGSVTSVSVVSANGFAGTVATATTTPAITLTTTITGLLKGNATAISAATSGTDYSAGTSALATGILKSTTTTGALTIAVAGDFPTLNQNTTGSAATLTTPRGIYGNNFDGSAALTQVIASTYGGTGNGFTKFTGPTTAEKTFTLPDANATIARTDAGQTFTGVQTMTSPALTTPTITGTPTGTGVATSATASTLVLRDANANETSNSFISGYATTVTAAGTTTLTVASAQQQYFTGTTTQTVTLPVTSTLVLGQTYFIENDSTGLVTVNSSGANAVLILAGGTSALFTCILTSGTTAASWEPIYAGAVIATGKKLVSNNSLTLAGTDGTTQTFQETDTIVGRATTDTLTNKRVNKRVLALSANSATPSINTDLYDVVHITSQTAAITSFTTNLTGTPVDGDTLRISVTGTGAVALTFGTSFEASGGVPLSTTTVTTARLDMGFFWNSETSKWRQVAQA